MRCENHETADDSVVVTLHFDSNGLTTTETPFGVVVELADLKAGGEPGAPLLPRTQLRVAVAEPLWPCSLKILKDQWKRVSGPSTFVAPAQRARPGNPGHKGSHCAAECSCRIARRPDRPPVAPGLPAPEFTPPNEDAYADAVKNPPPTARAVRIEAIGATRIAVVEVAPVRINGKGELELCTAVQLAIGTAKEPFMADRERAVADFKRLYPKEFDQKRVVSLPERFVSGLAEATRLRDIAISHVVNPGLIGRLKDRNWPIFELPSDYLIITDDVTWDAASITPGAPRPGLLEAFERLAEAKRARGITARVVSITSIVDGRWGDFRTGSRDLQEVIRRFLKRVRTRWGVNWLLLGGDVSILPVRSVAGGLEGGVGAPGTTSPPADNTSYWTGSHLNIHAVSLGTWWGASTANRLVRPDTGELIPYDSTGSSSSTSPGWYFTTGDDYATRSATATDFVRVEGPESLVKAPLQFLYVWNTLPTDFYYASLSSWVTRQQTVNIGPFQFTLPYVYVPPHDWDAIGNEIYGQFLSDGTDMDGVILQTDLCVGRAPVETAAEANTFVDKILAYERLGRFSWRPANRNWPRKMVFASSDWGGRSIFWPTTSTPPANGQYFHDSAASRSILGFDTAPTTMKWDVIARVTENDRRLLPYKRNSNPSVRGWYFGTSATDATPSVKKIRIPFGPGFIDWPVPSRWIIVHGSLEERTPQLYEFDWPGQDGSMSDQEALRVQVAAELPGIDRPERYYEDEFDLTVAEQLAAPVDFLTTAKLLSALNAAPHIVSLSGHGNPDGCCALSVAGVSSLTNGPLGFIAYADSCLTNMFDTEDAMSEALLKNPNGGAAAYVGNTRFSWIGVGDNFQRAFFHRLTATRHLGLLNDSRTAVFGTTGYWAGYDRWAVYTLNLLGDPELQVYRAAIPFLTLPPDLIHIRRPVIRVITDRRPPLGPPTPGDPAPVKSVLVNVRQGKREWSGQTDGEGKVYLPDGLFQKGEVQVTASHGEYAVSVETLTVG
jgi:hypothetical protein